MAIVKYYFIGFCCINHKIPHVENKFVTSTWTSEKCTKFSVDSLILCLMCSSNNFVRLFSLNLWVYFIGSVCGPCSWWESDFWALRFEAWSWRWWKCCLVSSRPCHWARSWRRHGKSLFYLIRKILNSCISISREFVSWLRFYF